MVFFSQFFGLFVKFQLEEVILGLDLACLILEVLEGLLGRLQIILIARHHVHLIFQSYVLLLQILQFYLRLLHALKLFLVDLDGDGILARRLILLL